ncbi:MAG: hypothetical protein FWH16_04095 [Oscillospiraceae bacterium]|nr:hypothetical protein [Oscillospiraceae bacterium]
MSIQCECPFCLRDGYYLGGFDGDFAGGPFGGFDAGRGKRRKHHGHNNGCRQCNDHAVEYFVGSEGLEQILDHSKITIVIEPN